MDAEVFRAGVVLAEVETRPEEDQSGPPAVECSTAARRCALRGGVLLGLARGGKRSGSCCCGWRHIGWFTSVVSGIGEQRNDVDGRARAREMAMVLAI
jgi:hypothetical protein